MHQGVDDLGFFVQQAICDRVGDPVAFADGQVRVHQDVKINLQARADVPRPHRVDGAHAGRLRDQSVQAVTGVSRSARVDKLIERRPNDPPGRPNDQQRDDNGPDVIEEGPRWVKPGAQHGQGYRHRAERVGAMMPGVAINADERIRHAIRVVHRYKASLLTMDRHATAKALQPGTDA